MGSGEWARSHRIIPLFQLLWPGMPDFTARFSSLCVNHSSARGPRRPQSPPPSPHDPSPPRSSQDPADPLSDLHRRTSFHNTTFSTISARFGAAVDAPDVSPRVHISTKIDHVKSILRDRLWPREEGRARAPHGGHFKADYKPERKVYLPPKCKSNN